jgi:hypothetical protein
MAKWSKKIKPCPFCGFQPRAEDPDCVYPVNREKTIWNLVCYTTGGGCDARVLGASAEEVMKKWNRRVQKNS